MSTKQSSENTNGVINEIIQNALEGDAESQYKLFDYYIDGEGGFEENEKLAIDNLMKASNQNHLKAQFQLAKCYKYGIGVEKNHDSANELFERVFSKQPELRKFLT